jgi:exopolysaccharide biosynthesis polyprenyl glycosylphosphotransferase
MLGPIPILTFYTVSLNPVQMLLKRVMDILGALIGLLITAVISLAVVPAILLDSPGPVFFRQTRVGKNGRKFQIYKFRTMYADSEKKKHELLGQNHHSDGRFFKIENDPRITRVGTILRKLSIDELPQFLNVLRGDMSLVGTRPPLENEVNQYNIADYRRISIKPGMTGMWQVSGRSDVVNFDDIVGLDTQYIDNWSISLDIYILFRTIFQVFVVKTAY